MKRVRRIACTIFAGLIAALATAPQGVAQSGSAAAAFDAYVRKVDARIQAQHLSSDRFLAPHPPGNDSQLRRGNFVLDQLTPDGGAELPGALLHHWRGTAFIPGATAAEFDRLLRDFPAYPQVFAPQVTRAAVVSGSGDHLQARMRIVRHHVLTVVMDTTYDVSFGQLNARDRWSTSRSTRISEVEDAGTPRERELPPAQGHGFLWRLDTWWTYQQRDGGVYVQIESVSLTRDIPTGLAWAVRPFIESIPRESLEFTLHAASNALRNEERIAQ